MARNQQLNFNLVVTYRSRRNLDKLIERAVRQELSGSGFGGAGRDLSFWFADRSAARAAARRVEGLRLPDVQTEVNDER